jgi:lysophospholipase L1-like esterase
MRKASSLLAAVAVAFSASVAFGAPAQAARVAAGDYVALGDSYASGVGDLAVPYLPESGDCKQSPNSYPRTFAKNHSNVTLKDMTCSGATSVDVREKQMSALSDKTTLVTLTVGGNDAGFVNAATACLTGTDDECTFATNLGAYYSRTKLTDDLAALYADIKARAPKAQIYVLGYPRVIDPEGTGSCGAITPNALRRKQMTHMADHMAEGIQDATKRVSGVTFIDMRLPFAGHEACTTEPFVNGVDANHITEIFHPNDYGHRVVYTFMLQYQTDVV